MCSRPASSRSEWPGGARTGFRGISVAAWLLAQSPVLPRHFFLEAPAVGRARLREALPPGPQILNSPACHPGQSRIVKGLDQAVRRPPSHAAPLGPPASWVRGRCSF